MTKKQTFFLSVLLVFSQTLCAIEITNPLKLCQDPEAYPALGKRFNFSDEELFKNHWREYGMPLMKSVDFQLCTRPETDGGKVLRISAASGSSIIVTNRFGIEPKEYPIIRWKWRMVSPISVPKDKPEPDDQAAVLYIGDGPLTHRTVVAYRWEHHTELGETKKLSYNLGTIEAHSICIRNLETPCGKWQIEERNYYEDFHRLFGRELCAPFALIIGANSQNTNSHSIVEIDYVEFLPKKSEVIP